jgi:hypothetical protein
MPLATLLLAAALIQVGGAGLPGGRVTGSATTRLERAPGGDTPVLEFRHPRGTVRLLLDTGASSSMVSPELVARLAVISHPIPPGRFELVGGGNRCEGLRPRQTRLPGLELPSTAKGNGSLRLEDAEALVLPSGALPTGIDGVLGAPSLRLFPIRIDPTRETLRLGGAALEAGAPTSAPSDRRPEHIPLRWRLGVPLMTITSPAGPVAALADTGAEGLFVSPRLAQLLEPLGSAQPLRLVGFCGVQPVQRQRLLGLALPGELPAPTDAIITKNPLFPQLAVEAIVGQGLLRTRHQLWRLDLQPPQLVLW